MADKKEQRIMKQGFVQKKTVTGYFKNWKQRFMVLKRSEISWQKDTASTKLGSLTISSSSSVKRIRDQGKHVILFESEGKELFIQGDSETTMTQWLIAIQDQIDSHKDPESSFFHPSNEDSLEKDFEIPGGDLSKLVLGEGSYGSVVKVTRKVDQKAFACKVIKRAELFQDGVDIRVVEREVNILLKLKHPYICDLEGFYVKGDQVFLIFELCEGGDLFERVSQGGRYTEENSKVLTRRLVEALCFCHKQNILHRDLKMENVVLENPRDDTSAKLIDFGLARLTGKDNPKFMTANVGTQGYLAPELMSRRLPGYFDKKCPEKVDVWGIGIIAFMVCTASHPFYHSNPMVMDKRISKGEYAKAVLGKGANKANISQEGRSFIDDCFTVNALKRPSMEDLLNHPWLKDVNLTDKASSSSAE